MFIGLRVDPQTKTEVRSFYEKNKEFIDYLAENSKNNLTKAMAILIKEIAENDR